MSAPAFLLVHSPLVGPLTWRPVADALGRRGYATVVPSLAPALRAGGPYYPALRRRVARAVDDSSATRLVVVAHSGAGALVPSVVADCTARGAAVDAAIFVDALLPHPGTSWAQSLPDELVSRLGELVTDGLFAPWHEWFGPGALAELLPDPDLRARFVAEVPRVPADYADEPAPEVEGWERVHRCYLRLSEATRPRPTRRHGRAGRWCGCAVTT